MKTLTCERMTEMIPCSSTLESKKMSIGNSVALVTLLYSNLMAKAGIIAAHMEYPDVAVTVAYCNDITSQFRTNAPTIGTYLSLTKIIKRRNKAYETYRIRRGLVDL